MGKELLFVEEHLSPRGGANCVSAWALQALKEDWNITIFTAVRPDFAGMNRHYGTNLEPEDFEILKLPFPFTLAKRFDTDPFSVQRQAWMMRLCRRHAARFDLLMSTCDEFDFGRPSIQYTHYPYLERHVPMMEKADALVGMGRVTGLFSGKIRPRLTISGLRADSLRRNLWLANSHWTAEQIRSSYRAEAQVLYPPVLWNLAEPSRDRKLNRFTALGRISPDKRLLELIEILDRLRSRGHDIGLDIIGDRDNERDTGYLPAICERADTAGGWIRIHQSVPRERLEEIVAGNRYGIHGKLDEHFGIAPAEMVRAGCIVFVPNSGGQVEIVDRRPGLCYDSDDDAVEKICSVLEDNGLQEEAHRGLAERAARFSEAHFMAGIREHVRGFFETSCRRPTPEFARQ
jgi:glycosyltransferase involved in cell wall biosynthesis